MSVAQEPATASAIARAIASRKMSALEATEAALARIARRDTILNSFTDVVAERARSRARAVDAAIAAGKSVGPLAGVPFAVKNLFDVKGLATRAGSKINRDSPPASRDATLIEKLENAGAVLIGALNMGEYAYDFTGENIHDGPSRNPHDPTRMSGGSSGGSGSAVGGGLVPIALGSDTNGSIRVPSSFCGIIGYKPSFGLINPQGVKPAAESLDTVGLMLRTVEDAELFVRVLTNSEPVRWLSETPTFRVGVCRTFAWDRAEEATRNAIEDAARRLEKAGFTILDVELPSPCEELPKTREIINDFERARGMSWEWNTHREQISEALAKAIRNGLAIPRAQYIKALERVDVCRQRAARLFDEVDVLLTPTVNGEAPLGLASTGDHRFQSIWTQLRTPAVTLPTHAGPNGMPVGIQLIGASNKDDKLLAIAQRVFAVLGRGPQIEL